MGRFLDAANSLSRTPISQAFLLGINQWSYGDEIFEGMPGMPKRASWPRYVFILVKFIRPKVLALDEMIPGYENRVLKRRTKHRKFTSSNRKAAQCEVRGLSLFKT